MILLEFYIKPFTKQLYIFAYIYLNKLYRCFTNVIELYQLRYFDSSKVDSAAN